MEGIMDFMEIANNFALIRYSLQALQNLQRILQSQLANVNPLHLQQAIQRQQVQFSLLDNYLHEIST
jgi:hypothetical protein